MSNQQDRSGLKVGLYVDVSNIMMNGGFRMRYDTLREFVSRDAAEPMRLNAYVAFDPERADADTAYRFGQSRFHSTLRDFGYKVIEKNVKWYTDEEGRRYPKANVDLDLAVDALLQSENMDRVVLATGDGDFVQVVRALQNRGCRVEVVAFDNVSKALRREADLFISGYLVPNLLPAEGGRGRPTWGEIDSVVRGVCYVHDPDKPFGYIRYLHSLSGELWRTDSRHADSAYRSIFFHDSELAPDIRPDDLPSRELILEFEIAMGEKGEKAVKVQRVNA